MLRLGSYLRLARAGFVLAHAGVFNDVDILLLPTVGRIATSRGNGSIRSWSRSNSRTTRGPTTSGRVARNWPSFT